MFVSRKAQTTCPECAGALDPIDGPREGNYVCCGRCFTVYRYAAGKYPRPASADELVRHLQVETFAHLKRQRLGWIADSAMDGIMEDAKRRVNMPRWKRLLERIP